MFITFEGGEGGGKTTQIRLLAAALERQGRRVLLTREPGGTPGAEAIRALLLTGEANRWDAETETLLFYAARADHVSTLIRPALAEGKVVLCDRFADSTRVYQGARGMGAARLEALHRWCLGDFAPDLTFVLDLDPALGVARAKGRGGQETRFEEMALAFHRAVREGFLEIARREPERCAVIDAGRTAEEIHRDILTRIESMA